MRVVVYTDIADACICDLLRSCIASQFKDGSVVIECRAEGLANQMASAAHSTAQMDAAYYVTESKTLEDADLCYAVFCARIPSLTLTACETLSPLMYTCQQHLEGDGDRYAAVSRSIKEFFHLPETSGRIIVMEGGDGAGKQTQTKLLVGHLETDGLIVKTLDFPHDSSLYGALVRVILSGKKGGITQLDPRLFSFLYSLNRYGCLPELREWVRRGYAVILDRYYTANFGHQASKLPVSKRKEFICHLERLEVSWLGLPKAGLVFYLDLPSKVALEAMKVDASRPYLDIHETAGLHYKEAVRQTYLWCCADLSGWRHIQCCTPDGERRSREALHELIYDTVQSF